MLSTGSGQDLFRVIIVAPVYCDWEAAALLCKDIAAECRPERNLEIRFLLVDDGSPGGVEGWRTQELQSIRSVEVLQLSRNLGHQRAIAIALCHVHKNLDCEAVMVMDADGEDRPSDVFRLIEFARQQPRIVFAERRRRAEGVLFRGGYYAYRILHRSLTGIPVRVGNFSIVPREHLKRLVCMSELWNHYVGAVFRSRLPYRMLPTSRGQRYCGKSKMSVIALVNHGLAGIASFQDIVATRVLIALFVAVLLVVVGLMIVIAIRLTTSWAVPGWATYSVGLLLVLLLQLAATASGLVFTLMTSRNNQLFVPIRDYATFVDQVKTLWPREEAPDRRP